MSARTLSLTVSPEQDGRRVRSLLQGPLGLSAGLVTRLKQRDGAVRLNGRPVRTLDAVRAGDLLEVDVGDVREGVFVPGGPALDILYEDEDLLIINTPAGIAVHGRSERGEPTIGAAVARYLGTAAPFHPVNRLDRGTTGAMCAAKNGYMHDRLRKILHTDAFRREYLALCCGAPPAESGVIDLPIARVPGEKKFSPSPEGLASLTRYEVLASAGGISLLRLRPETGRTHQIRVHLSALGCPIAGDRLYGGGTGAARPLLHSASLRLVHPLTGAQISVSAPLPGDMQEVLRAHEIETVL